jgi:hypothetical protein
VVKKGVETGTLTGRSLFGSFTDGGRKVGSSHIRWKNGFEPLREMDKDASGSIEGPELRNIALWFDNNRDGAVDDGEMLELTDVGVTKLRVASDAVDFNTGFPTITNGFDRVAKEGSTLSGNIIDWHAASSASAEGALTSSTANERARYDWGQGEQPSNLVRPDRSLPDAAQKLSGVWMVSLNSGSQPRTDAPSETVLMLEASIDGSVTGLSMSQLPIAPNERNVRNIIRASAVNGFISKYEGDYAEVTFEVNPQTSATSRPLRSKAVISFANNSMTGTTSYHVGSATDKRVLTWSAARLDSALATH